MFHGFVAKVSGVANNMIGNALTGALTRGHERKFQLRMRGDQRDLLFTREIAQVLSFALWAGPQRLARLIDPLGVQVQLHLLATFAHDLVHRL